MHRPPGFLRRAIRAPDLLASARAGALAVALFVLGVLAARHWADAVEAAATSHGLLAVVLFVATSAIAVLLPVLTNLPLVPFAALAWGPWWTAALLLLGWVLGAVASFALARSASAFVAGRFPSVRRHADIDRLIDPRHRLLSLVMLRMTFPVDVLSYALGLFSRQTRARDNALSTTIGGAPFALLFAFVPGLPAAAQGVVLFICVVAFFAYARWVLRRPDAPRTARSS